MHPPVRPAACMHLHVNAAAHVARLAPSTGPMTHTHLHTPRQPPSQARKLFGSLDAVTSNFWPARARSDSASSGIGGDGGAAVTRAQAPGESAAAGPAAASAGKAATSSSGTGGAWDAASCATDHQAAVVAADAAATDASPADGAAALGGAETADAAAASAAAPASAADAAPQPDNAARAAGVAAGGAAGAAAAAADAAGEEAALQLDAEGLMALYDKVHSLRGV